MYGQCPKSIERCGYFPPCRDSRACFFVVVPVGVAQVWRSWCGGVSPNVSRMFRLPKKSYRPSGTRPRSHLPDPPTLNHALRSTNCVPLLPTEMRILSER